MGSYHLVNQYYNTDFDYGLCLVRCGALEQVITQSSSVHTYWDKLQLVILVGQDLNNIQ